MLFSLIYPAILLLNFVEGGYAAPQGKAEFPMQDEYNLRQQARTKGEAHLSTPAFRQDYSALQTKIGQFSVAHEREVRGKNLGLSCSELEGLQKENDADAHSSAAGSDRIKKAEARIHRSNQPQRVKNVDLRLLDRFASKQTEVNTKHHAAGIAIEKKLRHST